MSSKAKKIGYIALTVVAIVVAALVMLPIAFKDKIKEIALKEVNKQLTADVGFEGLKISLIKDFPNASITLKDLYIAGRDKFEGDTLLHTKEMKLVVNMKSIFSGSGFEVKKFVVDGTSIFAHELADGDANWNIVPESDEEKKDDKDASGDFALKLQDVKILNTNIIFVSDTAKVAAKIDNLNVYLKGDFTADNTLLKTNMSVDSLSFWNEGIKYANNLALDFKADIEAYFNESRYVLANNEIKVNAIPLSLNGWVQMPDEAMEMDLTLNSEKVDFKSLLSLVPAIYSKEFDKLQADGNVSLNGFVKGVYHDESFPAFDFELKVDNGRFSYPDLPKSVDKVTVAAKISNEGGDLDMTMVDVPVLGFEMGGNPFSAKLNLRHPVSDMNFVVRADGKLDLGMIKEVYPLDEGMELNGLLKMDLDAAGRMSSVEQNRYEDLKFGGHVNVQDMLVSVPDLKQDIAVNNAELIFNDRYLNLAGIDVKIGDNDIKGSGRVENYLAYALRNQTLTGEMTINSNRMNLNDFMTENDAQADTTKMTVIEVPKNLNLTLNGDFKQLVFDKMNFTNAVAQMRVADGVLNINKMTVNAFGGTMALNGKYSTVNLSEPIVDFDVDLKQISFGEVMGQVKSLEKIAPILGKLAGNFDTKLSLQTLLAGDMMPILSSMLSSGSFKAELVTLKEDITALNALTQSLKLDKFSGLSLKDLALSFNIKDGKIETKPFNINIKDYNLNIGGLTGLDQSIAYAGSIKLPDNLNMKQFQTIGFKIGGTFDKPKVELDLKSTLTNLLEGEKEKLTDKVAETTNKALEEAQKRANLIMEQANLQSERLINEAKVQADSIVSKAKNPIAKELARRGADELVKQAEKQAQNINEKAKAEAEKLIKEAE